MFGRKRVKISFLEKNVERNKFTEKHNFGLNYFRGNFCKKSKFAISGLTPSTLQLRVKIVAWQVGECSLASLALPESDRERR